MEAIEMLTTAILASALQADHIEIQHFSSKYRDALMLKALFILLISFWRNN